MCITLNCRQPSPELLPAPWLCSPRLPASRSPLSGPNAIRRAAGRTQTRPQRLAAPASLLRRLALASASVAPHPSPPIRRLLSVTTTEMAEWRKWSVQHDTSLNQYEGKRVCDPPGFDPAAAREVRLGAQRACVEAGVHPGNYWRRLVWNPFVGGLSCLESLTSLAAASWNHPQPHPATSLPSHLAGGGQQRQRARRHQAARAEAAGAAAAAGHGAAEAGAPPAMFATCRVTQPSRHAAAPSQPWHSKPCGCPGWGMLCVTLWVSGPRRTCGHWLTGLRCARCTGGHAVLHDVDERLHAPHLLHHDDHQRHLPAAVR